MARHDDRQFAVLGLGRFGLSIARKLSENGYEVLGVDSDRDMVAEASEFVTHAIVADVTDEHAIRSIGLNNYDVVIMAMSEGLEAAILGTLLAKEMGVKFVLARARNDTESKLLKKVGADKVINPEMEMGARVATSLISGNILDSIELSIGHSIVEIQPLKSWYDKAIKNINIRSEYGLNLIAINRGKSVIVIIDPEMEIREGDVLVAIGDKTSINKFIKMSLKYEEKTNE